MRRWGCLAIVGLIGAAILCQPIHAQVISGGTNTQGTSVRKTPGQWITAARQAHSEWNRKAFHGASQTTTSGGTNGTSNQTEEGDFLPQLYTAMLETFFTEINSFLASIPTLLNLANLFGS